MSGYYYPITRAGASSQQPASEPQGGTTHYGVSPPGVSYVAQVAMARHQQPQRGSSPPIGPYAALPIQQAQYGSSPPGVSYVAHAAMAMHQQSQRASSPPVGPYAALPTQPQQMRFGSFPATVTTQAPPLSYAQAAKAKAQPVSPANKSPASKPRVSTPSPQTRPIFPTSNTLLQTALGTVDRITRERKVIFDQPSGLAKRDSYSGTVHDVKGKQKATVGLAPPSLPGEKEIIHYDRNGLYGAYGLGDLRALAKMVDLVARQELRGKPEEEVERLVKERFKEIPIECFNYEPLDDILAKHKHLANHVLENIRKLHHFPKEFQFNVHYRTKRNDLFDKPKTSADDWGKDARLYSDNMFFFNPYDAHDPQFTRNLIGAFFDHASTSISDDAVVTLMWNTEGDKDAFRESIGIKELESIADQHDLEIIDHFPAERFMNATDYQHLKNGRSLDRALSFKDGDITVPHKKTDTFILLKRKGQGKTIPTENVLLQSLYTISGRAVPQDDQ